VRHADEILIGVQGLYIDAQFICTKVKLIFESLQLTVFSTFKQEIRCARTLRTTYLGVDLSLFPRNIIVRTYKCNVKKLSSLVLGKIRFYIPIYTIILRLVSNGYLVSRDDGKSFRATRQRYLCTYNEYDIVKHFSVLIRGLVNYYSFVSQRSHL
jgi:hypothetical protein